MTAADTLTRRGPRPPRVWTPAMRWQLAAALEQGESDARIAARLGVRSARAVELARVRYGLQPRRALAWSAGAVARRMGVYELTVTRWIDRGWLHARRGAGTAPRSPWRVSEDALDAFLSDRTYWHAWSVEAISDPDLRQHAAAIRSASNERFLTTQEAARRLYVQPDTVSHRIRRGHLPGQKINGRWLVNEHDVDRCVPPPVGGYRKQSTTMTDTHASADLTRDNPEGPS